MEGVLGSLEKGKIANVILATGDLFEETTRVRLVFADGKKFKVEDPPAASRPAGAASPVGSWEGKLVSAMGELEITLELEQEGGAVGGRVKSSMGVWNIVEAAFKGDVLTFTVQAVIMGQSMELPFVGRVSGDAVEGAFSTSRGTMDVRLTRIPRREGD
jgi:hypothetical protein